MRRIISVCLIIISSINLYSQSDAKHPEWLYKIRMVSLKPEKGKKSDQEHIYQEAVKLKKQGVNTIMDRDLRQSLPGLPDGKAQWKSQARMEIGLPYSRAVKKAGLKLFHHTTSTFAAIEALENPVYKQWVSLDIKTGRPALRKPGKVYSDACFMDMNHPDFRKTLFARMVEYAERCQVDGWMTDEVEWLPNIYAGGSKSGSWRKFEKNYGFPYPGGKVKYSDPKWRKYVTFRYDSCRDFYSSLLKELQNKNKSMVISGCLAGISKPHRREWGQGNENWLSGLSMGFIEMEEGHCSRGKKAGYLPTTFWPKYYREMALYNANGEINGWPCSYALGYPRISKCENSEQFYLWAMSLSMGFRFWMRGFQVEPQWFAWDEKHEQDLVKPKLISDLGIFFPEWSRDFSANAKVPYMNWAGLSEAAAWNNICADQLIRKHLENINKLERFKLIIIPSNIFLSDKMVKNLKAFVAKGGTLLAVGKCMAQDPFSRNDYGKPMLELLGISSRSQWVPGEKTFTLEKVQGLLPAGEYKYLDGMQQVKPAPKAKVLASVKGIGPAVIQNKFGKGTVYYFTGRWGLSMYNNSFQKQERYRPTCDESQRKLLGTLIKNILKNKINLEVNNLPAKVMVNAYDTDGDFDGKYKRTIHFLDSFDGFEPGELIPKENHPCKFKQFAKRNGGKDIEVVLRGLKKINSAKMISPDFKDAKTLNFQFNKELNGYSCIVNPEIFGRYSIIVVDYN